MSLSVSPAAFVSADDYVAGVLDNAVTPRLYTVNTYSGGSTTAPPTSATPGVPDNGMTGLPQVASVTLVTAGDGVNDVQVGQVKLALAPNSGDVVNSSSPMELVLSPNALVVVASTSTG